MNKLKKIAILLSIVMLISNIFVSKTYAALNCNVSLSKQSDKVTYEEQFSVYVSISNLQTTKGIIAIGGSLSYDTNSLTLVDIEGENKWSDPMHNDSNGKFSSFKNKLSTSNENVLKITFKANEKGKAGNSAWIKIDNFEISDGDEEKNCGGSSVSLTISEPNNDNPGNENQGGNGQGNSNLNNNQGSSSGSNNKGSTTTKKPSTANTTNKVSTSDTNTKEENTNSEEIPDNNNVEENNVIEDNNVQNNLETDKINSNKTEKTNKDNKGTFYIVSIIIIVVIVVIVLLIKKFWKTN